MSCQVTLYCIVTLILFGINIILCYITSMSPASNTVSW